MSLTVAYRRHARESSAVGIKQTSISIRQRATLAVAVTVAFIATALMAVATTAAAQETIAQEPTAQAASVQELAVPSSVTSFGTTIDFGGVPSPYDAVAVASAAIEGDAALAITTSTGSVTVAGAIAHYGDAASLALGAPIVDIAITPSGSGYWLVGADGGVFTFGDAAYAGSVPEVLPAGVPLAQPIRAMVSTATGEGYWLFAADGGVFAFGDARFLGSLPQVLRGTPLASPIVGAATAAHGAGYWLVGGDGGVFTFGSAAYHGSAAPEHRRDIVDIAATTSGYLLLATDGTVRAYNTPHHGNLAQPARALAAAADGSYWVLPTQTLPSEPGQRGPAVVALQTNLARLGYWAGTVDGSYGHVTSQAVMAFQKWENLPRTGIADAATVSALETASRPTPASASGDLIEVDLGRQLIFVVRGGQVEWTFNTSTGSGTPYEYNGRWFHARTPTGRYDIYFERPDGWRVSHLGRLWRPKYFNGGIAFHGSGFIPGYPDSHGCARLSISAMDFFYDANLAPVGSQVWVY